MSAEAREQRCLRELTLRKSSISGMRYPNGLATSQWHFDERAAIVKLVIFGAVAIGSLIIIHT